MIAFVCIDNHGGMAFGSRRVSRDSTVIKRIINRAMVYGATIYIHPYSLPLFQMGEIAVSTRFLTEAGERDYCFVERELLEPYRGKIEALVVYKWNRDYPADTMLDIDLTKMKLVTSHEFSGTSHEKITEEIYVF